MTSSPTLSPSAPEKNVDQFHPSPSSSAIEPVPQTSTLTRWTHRLEVLNGFEARGIARVAPSDRHEDSTTGYVYMILLWLGANMSANNLAVALLGPLVFKLGFVDSALCATFGVIAGCIPPSYIATWGSESGNRTLVGFFSSKNLSVGETRFGC